MRPVFVRLRHHVKQEWFDVIEKRLMIEKHLREKAQVLAIDLVLPAVDFEDGYSPIAVDLVAWWMPHLAFELEDVRGVLLGNDPHDVPGGE